MCNITDVPQAGSNDTELPNSFAKNFPPAPAQITTISLSILPLFVLTALILFLFVTKPFAFADIILTPFFTISFVKLS